MTNSVNITVRDHASGMTPENWSLRSFGQLQMYSVPPSPAKTSRGRSNFYEEGKGSKNLERKKRLDGK